ncbi:hypothetical protein HanLR1_Chr05g0180511 [Helianthus annuus]|nr:hypothetical protein HanHA89_Chr05g0191081 [Helianthus annuus]KAJ0750321.1 hypothetical protein HanLR1_Chr05g0180511 [Helianthus annuus]
MARNARRGKHYQNSLKLDLKLISFKYKQTTKVKRFLEEWKMDKEDFLDDN